ncbi:TonB-dependent receptor [Gammaproteobacteria bacterium]|nr:TonB-dependent receptor [Gammaproteobacteria bacterium]
MKVILAALVSVSAIAQEADYELSTTAMHTIRSQTALPVTILTGDDLRDATRSTIGDTLSNQPGISNASFGPAVGQPVIRGQQGRRVLNLSNAVPNADASGNSADHAVAVEPILAEAIEVLRGPSTLLYGGGAIGGVVNVIDNRIPRSLLDTPVFTIEARYDSAADLDTVVSRLEFSTGSFTWHMDGMRREWNNLDIPGFAINPAILEADGDEEDENTSGYIANTGGETESFTFGGSWIFDSGFLGLAVNRIDNTYGLPPGVHGEHHEEGHDEVHDEEHEEEAHEEENIFIDMAQTRYDLTGELRDLTPWIEHLDYRLTYTDYGHAEMEGPGMVGTRFSNDSWQQRLQITHAEVGNWHGVVGLQTANETFGAIGEESFIPVTDIQNQGVFVVEDFHQGDFTMELGARLGRYSYDPENSAAPELDFDSFNYSASGLWDLSSGASLGLILSHAERAPSIEELYSNFALSDAENCVIHFATAACEIGDISLRKESSNNIDVTFYLEKDNFNFTLTAFNNNFEDYIALINTGALVDDFPIREYRQVDASFSGIEVDATFFINENFELKVFGDSINGQLQGNGDVPRMPPSRFGSRLDYKKGALSAFASFIHGSAQDEPGNFEEETTSYTRWDFGVNYSITVGRDSEVLMFARGRNTSDDDIRLSTSTLRDFAPEAGRSVEVGMRFSY